MIQIFVCDISWVDFKKDEAGAAATTPEARRALLGLFRL
jgi:hypothetical protein